MEREKSDLQERVGEFYLRTGCLTIVVNAETESRIERRLRQRDQKMQKPSRISVFLCI